MRASRPRRLPDWALAACISAPLALAYVIVAPASPDLAAASYRSWLFQHAGFTLWDNSWYGGHHLPAYSLLAPALGALVGPRLLSALSIVLASVLFALLLDGRSEPRATRLASAWLALGASIMLLSGRVPFDLGLALALGSLVLASRRRCWAALVPAAASGLASPVAGAFLALALLAWALAGPRRAWAIALALAALVPVGALALAFPEGGTQPFVASAFFPALAAALALCALLERRWRALRIGAALYALVLAGAYVVPSALGGNADRLGALLAGPVAACALAGASRRRRWALAALAPALLYWQAVAPVRDFLAAHADPSVEAAYYAPLLAELHALGVGYGAGARPARIEIVATADHWEARWMAPHVMLARGWERQLDTYRNALFYESSRRLSASRYRAWLAAQAISFVALPDARLDYSARAEARLVRAGLPYLGEVWRSQHWRLFAVRGATPLVQPPALASSASSDSLLLRVPRRAAFTVRVRFTPYWALTQGAGCVSRAPGGWTRVLARAPGQLRLQIRFSLARVFDHGPRCS